VAGRPTARIPSSPRNGQHSIWMTPCVRNTSGCKLSSELDNEPVCASLPSVQPARPVVLDNVRRVLAVRSPPDLACGVTRGVAHPQDLRAEVVAAVLAGTTIAQAARQYGLSKQTVSRWVDLDGTNGTGPPARDLGELILERIGDDIATIQAQLQATTRPEWLEKQPAAELAQLVAVERDTVLRLLAGLRPVDADDTPRLDAARAPEAADG